MQPRPTERELTSLSGAVCSAKSNFGGSKALVIQIDVFTKRAQRFCSTGDAAASSAASGDSFTIRYCLLPVPSTLSSALALFNPSHSNSNLYLPLERTKTGLISLNPAIAWPANSPLMVIDMGWIESNGNNAPPPTTACGIEPSKPALNSLHRSDVRRELQRQYGPWNGLQELQSRFARMRVQRATRQSSKLGVSSCHACQLSWKRTSGCASFYISRLGAGVQVINHNLNLSPFSIDPPNSHRAERG